MHSTTETPLLFAVMGVTGSGKSTFIKTITNDDSIKVGHDLKSCTDDVESYLYKENDQIYCLIDTPGFNDTFRTETEVLKAIASWLTTTYQKGMRLTGIIYLHPLEDRRMYGSSLRNLKMFQELCGESPMQNVVLVTTGWGTMTKAGNRNKAEEHERQLQEDPMFWKGMIKLGARTNRFEDNKTSALRILESFENNRPVTLRIQRELVDEKKQLVDTAAGQTVNEELERLEAQYKEDIAAFQQQLNEARAAADHEKAEIMAQQKEMCERLRDEARRAQDELRYQGRNLQRQHDGEIEDMKRVMRENHERQREELLKLKAQKYEEKMHFDGIVSQMRANEHKVRAEEREALEKKIKELEKKPSKKGLGVKLLLGILPMLGSVAMAALGFPMLGNPFSGLSGSA